MENYTGYISYSTKSFSFYSLHKRVQSNDLIVFPDYKRGMIWTSAQQSQFVESVLLGIPTQPLYIEESYDGKWIVLDGGQRIATVISFVEGALKLRGMEILANLNGYYFNDLPPNLIMKIEDGYVFPIVLLSYDTDEEVKAEIFKRLNTTGAQLTEQEIRNFLFKGESLQDLRHLSDQFLEFFDFQFYEEKRHLLDEFVLKLLLLLQCHQQRDFYHESNLNVLMRELPHLMPMIQDGLLETCRKISKFLGYLKIKRRLTFDDISSNDGNLFALSEVQFRVVFGLFALYPDLLNNESARQHLINFLLYDFDNPRLKPLRQNILRTINYLKGRLINDNNN